MLQRDGRVDEFCQRLAVDPNNNSVLYFGARSGKGLWKSTDYGKTWNKVTSFTSVGKPSMPFDGPRSDAPSRHVHSRLERLLGIQQVSFDHRPLSRSSPFISDRIGITWVTFDQTTGTRGSPTPRIFVGVAAVGQGNVFVSEDAGATCKANFLPQPTPHE